LAKVLIYRSKMPASAEEVYRFYAEPEALERPRPLWEKAKVVARTGGIAEPGSRVVLRVALDTRGEDCGGCLRGGTK
jgi:hypothetical protein